ncbi:hypothetical protein, partial [Vibrio anguillarum]|uniref:hypothetical protein n=1 Tax=Vibrio anguillarum TaxID=55601 RepID=UPI001C03F659
KYLRSSYPQHLTRPPTGKRNLYINYYVNLHCRTLSDSFVLMPEFIGLDNLLMDINVYPPKEDGVNPPF